MRPMPAWSGTAIRGSRPVASLIGGDPLAIRVTSITCSMRMPAPTNVNVYSGIDMDCGTWPEDFHRPVHRLARGQGDAMRRGVPNRGHSLHALEPSRFDRSCESLAGWRNIVQIARPDAGVKLALLVSAWAILSGGGGSGGSRMGNGMHVVVDDSVHGVVGWRRSSCSGRNRWA